MNTETCAYTFRADSELGTVLIAFTRVARQAIERLSAYERGRQRFDTSRVALEAARPPRVQSALRQVNAIETRSYPDVVVPSQINDRNATLRGLAFPRPDENLLSLIKIFSNFVKLLSPLLQLISIIISILPLLKSQDKCCEQLLTEFKKFADKDRTHVREARERLISLLDTDGGVEELVRHAENTRGRSLPDDIYETIGSKYGKQAKEDVLAIVKAREGLRAVRDLMKETTQAYKDAAAARAALTATEEDGLRTHQKTARIWEQQTETAQQLVDVIVTQGQETRRTSLAETARNRGLLMLTQQTEDAFVWVSNVTDQLDKLTTATARTNPRLGTHSENVGYVTEAYRELSEQIGATVGDVLTGAVSFKEAWESLGRGALDTVKHLGRQLLDSLRGSVRDVGRRLADVLFGQVQGALGSFGFGGSREFLSPFLGDALFHSGGSWRNLVSLLSNDSDCSGDGIPNGI